MTDEERAAEKAAADKAAAEKAEAERVAAEAAEAERKAAEAEDEEEEPPKPKRRAPKLKDPDPTEDLAELDKRVRSIEDARTKREGSKTGERVVFWLGLVIALLLVPFVLGKFLVMKRTKRTEKADGRDTPPAGGFTWRK